MAIDRNGKTLIIGDIITCIDAIPPPSLPILSPWPLLHGSRYIISHITRDLVHLQGMSLAFSSTRFEFLTRPSAIPPSSPSSSISPEHVALADKIITLINSSPRSPTKLQLLSLIKETFP